MDLHAVVAVAIAADKVVVFGLLELEGVGAALAVAAQRVGLVAVVVPDLVHLHHVRPTVLVLEDCKHTKQSVMDPWEWDGTILPCMHGAMDNNNKKKQQLTEPVSLVEGLVLLHPGRVVHVRVPPLLVAHRVVGRHRRRRQLRRSHRRRQQEGKRQPRRRHSSDLLAGCGWLGRMGWERGGPGG